MTDAATTASDTTFVDAVSEWVLGLNWPDVPANVRESTVRATLHSIAGGVAGFGLEEPEIALAVALRDGGGGGRYSVYVDGAKLSASEAIFVNSTMFCALERQEMHWETGTHPPEVVVPVVTVMAEGLASSGVEMLEAILVGCEVTSAFSYAGIGASVQTDDGSCHGAAVYGALGAAAAAARLLHLSVEQTSNALANAANLASGMMQCAWAGTNEYHYALANASRNGYLAAQLAASGAQATSEVFLGKAGFYRRFLGLTTEQIAEIDFAGAITSYLNDRWGVPEYIYKRYAVHFNNLPFIDAARTLRERHSINPDQIERVRIRLNRWCLMCDGGNLGPYHAREATCGATAFAVAGMLARGRFSLEENLDFQADDIMSVVSRCEIEEFETPEEANDWQAVFVEVTANGQTYVYDSTVDGIPDYRLPLAELKQLGVEGLTRLFNDETAVRAVEVLADLEGVEDFRSVVRLLVRS
jgi:2-methylcitrate dehydratase PrpD